MPQKFRAPVATGITAPQDQAAPRVDREAGIIIGASAMQAVEALGHGVIADELTLAAVAGLGNAAPEGVKVRFTHPGLCADGMGTYLGRMRDFRVQGDKVVGDIHLGQAAASSPDGDLRAYVLQLAEEDPGAFGMSVVVEGGRVWKCADGREDPAEVRPEDAVGEMPFLRPTALFAVDVVDEPAANRDGLFGRGAALLAMARGTNLDAQDAFAVLDRIRDQLGWPQERVASLLAAYLQARTRPQPIAVDRVAALIAEFPADAGVIAQLAAGQTSEDAIRTDLERRKSTALAASSRALLERYETETKALRAELAQARDERDKALALAQLAAGAPKDQGTAEGEQTLTAAEFAKLSPTARAQHIRAHGVGSVALNP